VTVCPTLAAQSQSVPDGADAGSSWLGSVELTTGGELSAGPLTSTEAPRVRSKAGDDNGTDPASESEIEASRRGFAAVRVTVSLAEA